VAERVTKTNLNQRKPINHLKKRKGVNMPAKKKYPTGLIINPPAKKVPSTRMKKKKEEIFSPKGGAPAGMMSAIENLEKTASYFRDVMNQQTGKKKKTPTKKK
jgi:hypothetical protein